MNNELIEDTNHWQSLVPPLAPNQQEINIYEELCKDQGPICMLGMTKELVHVCDLMADLNPIPQVKPVFISNWNELSLSVRTIIGDGVLNLEGLELVEKLLSNNCERLICRVFLKELDGMKYATHFPNEFPGAKKIIQTQQDVVMVLWERSS